ncbi:MAG: DNA polymerase I [Prevotellaceae bacterium]|nr:DNA polymerase I [Prevotellaceae bacterium]
MDKLFLLDAYALIYRAYYALIKNPRINSKKQNTSAIFGFVNTLEEILNKENPTHIAVAFDPKGKTFRHEAYPEYKAQREETPEDIRQSLPIIKDILHAYNIPILEVAGYEADDVIGTIAQKAGKRGILTYMMTPDKDYGQLVSENVLIYKPGIGSKSAEKLGPKEICDKYGIKSPEQVIDILGLMGDAVDNVPGCPGVGEKTACTLMQSYNSIEEIYEDPSRIKGKLREKLEANKEQVLFSKFLVRIKTDVPIDFDDEALRRKEPDKNRLRELFKELEFRALIKKLLDSNSDLHSDKNGNAQSATRIAKTANNAKNAPVQLDLFATDTDDSPSDVVEAKDFVAHSSNLQVQIIENKDEQARKLAQIFCNDKFSFSIVGTSISTIDAKMCALALRLENDEHIYLKLDENFQEHGELFALLKALFENESTLKICHDIKRQAQLLKKIGIDIKGKLFDTMLAHYVLQPELRHGLNQMAENNLGITLMPIENVFGEKWNVEQDFSKINPTVSSEYFARQLDAVARLYPLLHHKLERESVLAFYEETEVPLALVLADMEQTGVKINTESLNETSQIFTTRMNEYEALAHEQSGIKFNISSPKQVGEVLFERLKLSAKAKKTKTGQYVTSEEVLESLRADSSVVDNILKYRAMKKLLSTYVDALPKLINPFTGHIHSSFNQAVTATGRLSSSDPNLQNIPVRSDDGKEIRKAFIPEQGQLFFSADYSQIELRVMAHLSGDKHMIEAFQHGNDVHAATAAKIFHKKLGEVTPDERRKAKTANFGIMYGISVFGLAQRMDVSRTEAKELIDGYFNTYTGIRDFIENTKERAKKNGFIETISHRRRYIPDINSHNAVVRGYAERNAVNAPIQGSASDIIKIAMVRIFRRFIEENIQSKLILQVHDELNFSVLPEEREKVEQIVKYEMEHAAELKVPLLADCGWGSNWLEAH